MSDFPTGQATPGVYVFNASSVDLMFTFNGGTNFTHISKTSDTASWQPFPPNTNPTFVNQSGPLPGQIGLGDNSLTMYPGSGGPAQSATVHFHIPETQTITSLQVFFVWKDAGHLGVVVCNGGQFVETIALPAPTQSTVQGTWHA